MRRLATEAMAAGALGFSTSRTLNHRTATGDPTPSLKAGAAELEAIVLGVADAGHGVVELISDFSPDAEGEFAMVRRLVEISGRPLSVSLAQSHERPEAWRGCSDRLSGRRLTGSRSGPRWLPDPSACCSGSSRRSTRSRGTPSSPRSQADRSRNRCACCTTPPSGHASSRARPPVGGGGGWWTPRGCSPWARCPTTSRRPARACRTWPRSVGSTRPSSPSTCWWRTAGGPSSSSRSSTMRTGNLDACGEMLSHPDTLFGLGDGGADVGIISDASFPTWFLSHWARDRSHGRMPVGTGRRAVDEQDRPGGRSAATGGWWQRA